MSKNKENLIKQRVERKVNYHLYFLMDYINALNSFFSPDCFSEEIVKRYNDLIEQIQNEVGELDCDELQGEYVVEYGYKYLKND